MKRFLILTALFIFACSSGDSNDYILDPNNSSAIKILPLGASRVEGARPDFESYRFNLWKNLKEHHWTFDFIGTQSDNASYPLFNGNTFDTDHEGRGGWTSSEILEGLNEWLSETGPPDIVLISSPGGNDALQGLPYAQAVSNIISIIDVLQLDNPNITIIIEQMAPGHSEIMTDELSSFIEQMQQEVLTIAANKTTTTSQIIPVDMFTGFNDSLLADDVHYNEDGAEFIAERYYQTLVDLLE